MKVILPDNRKSRKKMKRIYAVIIVICIISVIVAFYVQFYARINIKRLLGFETEINFGNKTEEQIENYLAEFDNIFTNGVEEEEGQVNFKRVENDKPIVYTKLAKKESKLNSYDVEVYIPYININNEIVEKYNQEIEDFVNKTNNIIESTNENTIYTVEYAAHVYNDILSLIIRSNLKEGNKAQRVIVQTYNYDLRNNKAISLEEVLKIEDVNIRETQDKIKNEITAEQKKVEDLKELGYTIYSRDVESDMYNIKNSTQFYLTNKVLYVIYAYGNETYTSEMDVIII